FNSTARVQPFVGFGVGLTSWKVVNKHGEDVGLIVNDAPEQGFDTDGQAATLSGKDLTLGLELGVDIGLGDHLALALGGRLNAFPGNKLDNVGMSSFWGADYVDANTASLEGFLGLTWWFGSSDRDHDGVPNYRDACPTRPEDRDGWQDDDGCPELDNDGDGIADVRDGCPNDAEDHDGFEDLDGCPDPDNDGDGIIDAQDRCPNEAEDLDGFADDDGCPDPDNDGDGVLDAADRCPDTPAGTLVDGDGCPVVAAPAPSPAVAPVPAIAMPVAGQTIALENVAFESGSARLTPASVVTIDAVAQAMKDHPDMAVEIRGHTDAVGAAEVNLDLSQRRATAVRDALIQRGIAPARVTAVGYGEDFPVADNGTPEGRAANRRVELYRVR
ncbi:MAG TPA: OmpA family protein, partial [Candidatus Krumholzibacteria bacterium]|nr:OmpA family protein [Candidatus Krumholzibacteria bacterium]